MNTTKQQSRAPPPLPATCHSRHVATHLKEDHTPHTTVVVVVRTYTRTHLSICCTTAADSSDNKIRQQRPTTNIKIPWMRPNERSAKQHTTAAVCTWLAERWMSIYTNYSSVCSQLSCTECQTRQSNDHVLCQAARQHKPLPGTIYVPTCNPAAAV